ncbi:MAG: hypothetical protein B7Z66_09010 [Chromatiales bacterium 21-64-14]|nr:MAG: hypothetical protein B7Z66_09010 [Chromatiales bacterium 21-64-14]HQU15251.1 hypothetical protein [Gammaproteobacteria bacterium]
MRNLTTRLSTVFAAGCIGGLLNSVAVWGFGAQGITQRFGVHIAPGWHPGWLYPRIVWGGIWAALFLLPVLAGKTWVRGLLFSLVPTAVQLLVVFPMKAHKGMWGLELGAWTPAFVVFFNAVWGLAAAAWLRMAGAR